MNRFLAVAIISLGLASQSFAESWMNAANGYIGSNPVLIGREGNVDAYVCRAAGIPGKLIPRDGKCYIGYYGNEHAYTSYQVLQDPSGRLRFFSGSALSDDYLIYGGSENGITLHICRVRLGTGFVGGKLVGPVQNGKCYYGYYGREYMSQIYDALSNA